MFSSIRCEGHCISVHRLFSFRNTVLCCKTFLTLNGFAGATKRLFLLSLYHNNYFVSLKIYIFKHISFYLENAVTNSLIEDKRMFVVFFDYVKAFGTIWKYYALRRLHDWRFSSNLPTFISSFFRGRTFSVRDT